jgi:hypothetical protein
MSLNSPERQVYSQRGPAGFEGSDVETCTKTDDAARQVRVAPAQAQPDPSKDFWIELNATLDAFFTVISASKERLAELTAEIAKRDRLISLLDSQNVSLRARLGLADNGAAEKLIPCAARTSTAGAREPAEQRPFLSAQDGAAPAGPGPARSIWHKLTKLEREL